MAERLENLLSELQRELAFFFAYWHEQQRHRTSAMACMENECVRVRNLALTSLSPDDEPKECGHISDPFIQRYASFAGIVCDHRKTDGSICGHVITPAQEAD
jgi:hypothetical protein